MAPELKSKHHLAIAWITILWFCLNFSRAAAIILGFNSALLTH
ncbi:hypothetical protein [Laspinema olomoucense]|nr:hypothetical protein [Laspinema sp. D3a]